MKTLDLQQRLEIYKFCLQNDIDYNEMKEILLGKKYPLKFFGKIKNSLGDSIQWVEILKEEYHEDDNGLYDYDNYEVTDDGVYHRDDCWFCEGCSEYHHINNNSEIVNEGRNQVQLCEYRLDRGNYWYYEGEYYDQEAMERHCLVVDICGNVRHQDDVYYWESDGEYHDFPEEEDEEEYVRAYHNGGYKRKNWSDNPQFFIGFEIEKEDKDVKESIEIRDFEDKCPLWRKERDGSLNDESGYELISPTFELDVEKIFEHIESNQTLVEHINAEKGLSCGGHINVSEAGLTGQQLFDKVKGYTPLFHALYYKRMDKTYSKGKSNKDLSESCDKYQSIRIHDNRIEYRIISAVPNVSTLKWRTKLIEFILNNPTDCPKQAFFNIHSIMLEHIKEMYNDSEKLNKLMYRIIKFTKEYEGIELTEIKLVA